jgi:hypothetical protein
MVLAATSPDPAAEELVDTIRTCGPWWAVQIVDRVEGEWITRTLKDLNMPVSPDLVRRLIRKPRPSTS